jgi:hypothetical protein
MAGFAMRKNQRLKKLVPVRYLGDGIAGEGIIEDLSLSGSYITGKHRSLSAWRSPCKFLCQETRSRC